MSEVSANVHCLSFLFSSFEAFDLGTNGFPAHPCKLLSARGSFADFYFIVMNHCAINLNPKFIDMAGLNSMISTSPLPCNTDFLILALTLLGFKSHCLACFL